MISRVVQRRDVCGGSSEVLADCCGPLRAGQVPLLNC